MKLISKYSCRHRSCVIGIFFSVIVTLMLGSQLCCAEDVKLQWDPSPSATVVGYKVHIKIATESSSSVVDVGNVTSYFVRGLSRDMDYIFSVTAYDAKGSESTHSNLVYWNYEKTDTQSDDVLILKVFRKNPLMYVVALISITVFAGIGIIFYKRRKSKAVQ